MHLTSKLTSVFHSQLPFYSIREIKFKRIFYSGLHVTKHRHALIHPQLFLTCNRVLPENLHEVFNNTNCMFICCSIVWNGPLDIRIAHRVPQKDQT